MPRYGLTSARPAQSGGPSGLNHDFDTVMAGGATDQVDTITVGSFPGGSIAAFTVTLEDGTAIAISYTSGGGSVGADAILLEAALDANAAVSSVFEASASSADVVLTATTAGVGWTISAVNVILTLVNTTANADAAALSFGRAVVRVPGDTSSPALVKNPLAGDYFGDIWSVLAADFVAAEVYGLTISVDADLDGKAEDYVYSWTSGGTTETQWVIDMVDAITQDIGLHVITPDFDPGEPERLVLTGALGYPFTVACTATVTDGGGDVAGSLTASLDAPNNGPEFMGVIAQTHEYMAQDDGTSTVPAGRAGGAIVDGDAWVEVETGVTPAETDVVFYRHTATGSESLGTFSNTIDDTDQFILPRSRGHWITGTTTTDINGTRVALLRLRR